MFNNIWFAFYLICYSRFKNFNIFLTTAKLDKTTFDYIWVNLMDNDYIKIYNNILKENYLCIIRHDTRKQISVKR